MYAIVETGGKQYKVKEGAIINVEKIKAPIGQEIELEKVLMVCKDEDNIIIGTPTVESGKVVAEVVNHIKGEKITIMKFKRRKHYKRKIGHRQQYTQLRIKSIEMPENS